jgi:hypothetical protein
MRSKGAWLERESERQWGACRMASGIRSWMSTWVSDALTRVCRSILIAVSLFIAHHLVSSLIVRRRIERWVDSMQCLPASCEVRGRDGSEEP